MTTMMAMLLLLSTTVLVVVSGELRGMTLRRQLQGNTKRQLKRAKFALRRKLEDFEEEEEAAAITTGTKGSDSYSSSVSSPEEEAAYDGLSVDTERYESTLEKDLEKLKAEHLIASVGKKYLQKYVLQQALEETERLLDPSIDPDLEEPFVASDVLSEYRLKKQKDRKLQSDPSDDYANRERRILFYGDNQVLGVSSAAGRYPPGPMLEEGLVSLGYNAKVSSVGLSNWSARYMRSNVRRVRFGIIENIRRTAPEIVILSAGHHDILRRETNVEMVINWYRTIVDTALAEFGVRWVVVLPIAQWELTDEDPEREAMRVAVNEGLAAIFETHKRVDVQPLAFQYHAFGAEEADPYYARNNEYFSELGYQALADYLVAPIDFFLKQPYRIFLYGDSITLGNVYNEPHNPYRDALEATLQSYGWDDVAVTLRAYPGWRALPSYASIESHRLGLTSLLSFGILSMFPVDVMILLLGTNDLKFNIPWTPVHTSLIGHHVVAYREHVKYSIGIEVPTNRHIDPNVEHLYNEYQDANTTLLNYWQRRLGDKRLTVVEWPFPYDVTSEEYPVDEWWSDGFHPTPMGYDFLGEYLAPTVQNLLEGQQRIYCFGDQFTTGRSSGTTQLYPYAFFLENQLRGTAGTGREVVVGHLGNLENTAAQLAQKAQPGADIYGLSEQLAEAGTMDLVIIWAGMYDLRNGGTGSGSIINAISELVHIARNHERVKHVLVIGVPPSETTETKAWQGFKRADINQGLADFAAADPEGRTTFFDFPFARYDPLEPEWGNDGFLLTREGHINLATALYPVVDAILSGAPPPQEAMLPTPEAETPPPEEEAETPPPEVEEGASSSGGEVLPPQEE
eukprot:CAMPEP_0194046750 /NCGR_PEP_ID=MMETSP0009_2-20130614/22279_1 /TAXON_ID=210454 /ORGANISM="Grammatophora oceanica, Strain CCMP 410" /LENGTH=851 /DNA_ID=CAMNT_0038692157 /DNA_START=311 /DNA_END=2866 /DNA_ORIENTATION=+